MLPRKAIDKQKTPFSFSRTNSGQAVLLVLLGMAVTLTIVMSIVSRSITDISLSQEDEESARAFSAAEAGVEEGLLLATEGDLQGEGYTAHVSGIAKASSNYNIGELEAGESATLWFVSHDKDGNLTCTNSPCYSGRVRVCWGTLPLYEFTPALEITVYYDMGSGSLGASPNFSNVRVARFTADPFIPRADNNKFSKIGAASGACTIEDKKYDFLTSFRTDDLGGRPLFARLKLLYNTNKAHGIGVVALDGTFPSQGLKIESVGSSGSSVRKVETMKPFKETLSIFEAGLFSTGSGADLVKPE
jgi:Tfp pilus assembly protein PilX